MAIIEFRNKDLTIIYVDSSRPDDTGDGTTPATAKKNLPIMSSSLNNHVLLLRRNSPAGTYINKYSGTAGAVSDMIILGMPKVGQPLRGTLPAEAITAWGSDPATNEAVFEPVNSSTSISTGSVNVSGVSGWFNLTYAFSGAGTTGSPFASIYSNSSTLEFFFQGNKVRCQIHDDPLVSVTDYTGARQRLIDCVNGLSAHILGNDIHRIQRVSANVNLSYITLLNIEYVDVSDNTGVITSQSGVNTSSNTFIRVGHSTSDVRNQVFVRNLDVKGVLQGPSTNSLAGVLSVFGARDMVVDNIKYKIAHVHNSGAKHYTNVVSNTAIALAQPTGSTGSVLQISNLEVDLGNWPGSFSGTETSPMIYISSTLSEQYVSGGSYIRNIKLGYTSDSGSNTTTAGYGAYIYSRPNVEISGLDIKWLLPHFGPALSLVEGYTTSNNKVEGQLMVKNSSLCLFDTLTNESASKPAVNADLSRVWVANLVANGVSRTSNLILGGNNVYISVGTCNVDVIGSHEFETIPTIQGGITVNSNNGVTGNYFATNSYYRAQSWSVGRTGGSSSSIKWEGVSAPPSAHNAGVLRIPEKPFKGSTFTPGTTGSRTLSFFLAAKNFSDIQTLTGKCRIILEVPYDDGGKVRHRVYTSGLHAQMKPDGSMWTGDTALVSLVVNFPIEVTSTTEPILITYEYDAYEMGAYVYLDPVPVES